MSERKDLTKRSKRSYWYSNEGQLHRLFPYIKDNSGSVFAVGSDQGLDLLVNSGCERVELVDRDRRVNGVMRAVLEVAKARCGLSVDTESRKRFFEDFDFANLKETRHMLGGLKTEDREVAMEIFEAGVPLWPLSEARESYGEYMRLRSGLKDESGKVYTWYGSTAALSKVVDSYRDKRIVITAGDLRDPQSIEDVSESLERADGSRIGILYLSNAEDHIIKQGDAQSLDSLWRGLYILPFEPDAKILRTAQVVGQRGLDRVNDPFSTPFFNIQLPWHYNVEALEHHMMLATTPRYRSKGWMRVAKGYRRIGFDTPGVSCLTVPKTKSLLESTGIPLI